jgi:hypothetical protein
LRLLLLAAAVGVPLLLAEAVLQLAPGLLPGWYRRRFPPNGIEFFHPGLLDRTPITGVPLPYGVAPYDGPPPHDLVDAGVATLADAVVDRRAVPRLVLPADADGLPNTVRPAHPDLALVGDSFTVFAAQLEPPGLQRRLEERLGAAVLNVAISGIGPDQELDLLERVALPARPRLVVWMFFGGNDLIDSLWTTLHRAQGIATLGELFADRRAPSWRLPGLLLALAGGGGRPAASAREPLPGLRLPGEPEQHLWFYPDTLRVLAQPPATIADNPGWQNIRDVLRRSRTACERAGARLLVVFLPSKEQIWLPRVVADAPLLQRFVAASNLYAVPVPADPQALLADLLAHRGALEALLAAFCGEAGLGYWSATPVVEAFVETGQIGYYACDSHWRSELQLAVAEALAGHIQAASLLAR